MREAESITAIKIPIHSKKSPLPFFRYLPILTPKVITQANSNKNQAEKILDLYNQKKSFIPELTNSTFGITALDMLFERPVFTVADMVNSGRIPRATARRIIKAFKDANWLIPINAASGRRSELMAFPELINITEGYDVFKQIDKHDENTTF